MSKVCRFKCATSRDRTHYQNSLITALSLLFVSTFVYINLSNQNLIYIQYNIKCYRNAYLVARATIFWIESCADSTDPDGMP